MHAKLKAAAGINGSRKGIREAKRGTKENKRGRTTKTEADPGRVVRAACREKQRKPSKTWSRRKRRMRDGRTRDVFDA